jgi:hypothetical protein
VRGMVPEFERRVRRRSWRSRAGPDPLRLPYHRCSAHGAERQPGGRVRAPRDGADAATPPTRSAPGRGAGHCDADSRRRLRPWRVLGDGDPRLGRRPGADLRADSPRESSRAAGWPPRRRGERSLQEGSWISYFQAPGTRPGGRIQVRRDQGRPSPGRVEQEIGRSLQALVRARPQERQRRTEN